MSFVFGSNSASTGYNLTRSLRFRASATGYLSKTFGSAGSQQKWTFSAWVKRGLLGSAEGVFIGTSAAATDATTFEFRFGGDALIVNNYFNVIIQTSAVYRDPSAWYHVVLALDTTQATASDRLKLYVNGSQVTAFATDARSTYITQNSNLAWNGTQVQGIGATNYTHLSTIGRQLDGYLAEVNFINNQQLTPSSFGSTNALTGVWQPAAYTGTYGTNGFYLPFTDNSALTTASNAGLGKDFSGNANYFVTNNISITAGVTYDSMTDVPTLTSATASNFCVWNPLDKDSSITASDGNLSASFLGSTEQHRIRGNISFPSSSKTYFEITVGSSVQGWVGIGNNTMPLNNTGATSYGINETGRYYVNGTYSTSPFSGFTTGNVIGIAVDTNANTITFYKNGVAETPGAQSITSGLTYFPVAAIYNAIFLLNCGQRPFSYTPPTGFVALNTYNLPTSTIVKGNTVMDATTYTGDGTTPKSQTNAAGFKPDFVWIKSRSNAYSHNLFDSVRGAGAARSLQSDNTKSEADIAVDTALYGYLSAFNSNGFSTTNGSTTPVWVNASGSTYVAWQWQAGQGTTSSNTNGTITSTVSVNASAGFSVVTFTTTAGVKTVGHGLGVAPALIIVKPRAVVADWYVYGSNYSNTQYLKLNTTDFLITDANLWNSTSATSSVFTLGSSWGSGNTLVAYCWTPIAGFSAFGSYTGNGSADGPFIYLGFRPRWILTKSTTDVGGNWAIYDTARDTYNVMYDLLLPNSAVAESAYGNIYGFDILSNGFKIRNSLYPNTSAGGYIYAAFAENPFKNSLAR